MKRNRIRVLLAFVLILCLTMSQMSIAFAGNMGDTLASGGILKKNDYLQSKNGKYVLSMQNDGNLVIYDTAGTWKALWAARTNGCGDYLEMNTTGSLMVRHMVSVFAYFKTEHILLWSFKVDKYSPGAFLVMQNDGNLVLYSKDWKALWCSGSYQGQ